MPNRYGINRDGITRDQYGRKFEYSPKEVKRFRKYQDVKYKARKPRIVCVERSK